jgi:hypothetical protein
MEEKDIQSEEGQWDVRRRQGYLPRLKPFLKYYEGSNPLVRKVNKKRQFIIWKITFF